MAGSNPLVFRNDDFTGLIADIEAGDFTTQALGHQGKFDLLTQHELVKFEEAGEDFFVGHAQCTQQRGDRHLAATVDAEEQSVLRVKFKIYPRTTVRNHTGREQQLARRVSLAAIMLEEHPRRAVQLAHDNALGTVDHERTGISHERNLAHVDFLLFHFLDVAGITIQDDQTDAGTQG